MPGRKPLICVGVLPAGLALIGTHVFGEITTMQLRIIAAEFAFVTVFAVAAYMGKIVVLEFWTSTCGHEVVGCS